MALLALTLVVFASGSGRALAGPEDEARHLVTRIESLVATGVSPTQIFVGWTPPLLKAGGVYSYRVEIATDEEGPYTAVPAAKASCSPTLCTTLVGATPPSDPTPRWIRVVPIITLNAPKNPFNIEASVPVLEGVPSRPDPAILASAPPTNLRCNGQLACVNVTTVNLTWNDNSDEYQFWIYRTRAATNPTWPTEPVGKVPANTTTFTEAGLELERAYYYKVVAIRMQTIIRSDGTVVEELAYSDAVGPDRIRVETPRIPAPLDPTGLTVVFQPVSKAQLTWTDNATDEDGYFVEWGPDCSNFEFMTAIPPRDGTGAMTWTDQNLPADTGRCYKVRAYRFGPAYSGYTAARQIGSIPIAPTNLRVTGYTNATVDLAWADNSQAEDSFDVQRCTGLCTSSSSSWVDLGSVPQNTTTFTDATTSSLTTYTYRVFAANSSGRSASSNLATVTTLASPIPAPSNLVATGIGSHSIQLQWKDNSTNETGFRVEYRTGDGEWVSLFVVGSKSGSGSLVSAIDTESLPANTSRCYRVRAVRPGEMSDPSNVACGTTLAAAPPNGTPGKPSATAIDHARMTLTFQDNATNEDGFRIYARAFSNELCASQNPTGLPFSLVGSAGARGGTGTVQATVTGLLPHTAYFFKIVAFNQDGVSPDSPVSDCAATFGPPRPIFVDPATDSDFELTRCDVTVRAPAAKVDRMRLYVVSNLPGTGPYKVDTLWLEDPTAGDQWVFQYQFRKGTHYGLLATSYGDWVDKTLQYPSVEVRLRDITVAADCPIEPDPVDPEPAP